MTFNDFCAMIGASPAERRELAHRLAWIRYESTLDLLLGERRGQGTP